MVTWLRIAELEQELKEVHEAAAVENKKLEDELAEERRKTKEANAQFNSLTIGKVDILCCYPCSRVEDFCTECQFLQTSAIMRTSTIL
jgi:hypothetical protein